MSRTRGVTLTRVDLDSIRAEALEHLNKHRAVDNLDPIEDLTTHYDWAVGVNEDTGAQYLICSEGVAYEIGIGKTAPVAWFAQSIQREGEASTFSIFPSVTSTLDNDDVFNLPRGEDVDLADFVRAFGARLETNFSIIHSALTAH